MNRSVKITAPVILMLFSFASCEVAAPLGVDSFKVQLKKEIAALLMLLRGRTGQAAPKSMPSPSPGVVSENGFSSEAARRAKANSELLHEMYAVVFQREPEDRADFGSYVDTLNQGGSYEGVYNGFVHSSIYRQLEVAYPKASKKALKVFSEELAELESELPEPTKLNRRTVEGASVYVLKRIIGDEAQKVVGLKKETKEELCSWYSKFVVRMCSRNVDFGIGLRNKADEKFHYQWALSVTEDQLLWEVLNRLHRVLNAANEEKQ